MGRAESSDSLYGTWGEDFDAVLLRLVEDGTSDDWSGAIREASTSAPEIRHERRVGKISSPLIEEGSGLSVVSEDKEGSGVSEFRRTG